ncbi:MAG: dTDP-4-dehydrorhamnose reductase [Gammaproteobacteria bacterium]|nr:dTDP-4-dehydrorhamnose reductase [Gammaproteobacteria bacterium]
MIRILLVGKNGQIGWELQRTLSALGELIATDRQSLDLANVDMIRKVVNDIKPQLIVNASAYTAVDQAESEFEAAMTVNAIAPGILADEAKKIGAALIHYSTDYVFDGKKASPYHEEDICSPLNIYGESKKAGEIAIQNSGCVYIVLRTSWIYGNRGKNFLKSIVNLSKQKHELKIVDDQIGSPTWCRSVAEYSTQIIKSYLRRSFFLGKMEKDAGIYHISATNHVSWYGFAERILKEYSRNSGCALAKLVPITTSEYPLPAKRPKYTVLSNDKINKVFGIKMPAWEDMLTMCLSEMYQTESFCKE